jgi:hypothetical protein
MTFRYSLHSIEQIKIRRLNITLIEEVLNAPDKVITNSKGVDVYQKLVIENNISYLYRVFVNITKQPAMIITAYKTSKVNKYENPI